MKRTKAGRIAIYIVLIGMLAPLAQSCRARKCGCGADIMGTYKPHKSHNY